MRSRTPVRLGMAALLLAAALPSPRAAAEEPGVTLFRDRRLRGPSETFTEDVPNLNRTRIGARTASSIAVPPGCVAVLYAEPWFRGRRAEFRGDDNDLSNTEVGEDTAQSLRVECRRHREDGDRDRDRYRERPRDRRRWDRDEVPDATRGVTLFRDRDLEGPSAFFDRDVPDLDDTEFGARMASSLDVSPGCTVILYERPNYRGRRTEFRDRDNNLKNTPVGEDAASSLQVRCN